MVFNHCMEGKAVCRSVGDVAVRVVRFLGCHVVTLYVATRDAGFTWYGLDATKCGTQWASADTSLIMGWRHDRASR